MIKRIKDKKNILSCCFLFFGWMILIPFLPLSTGCGGPPPPPKIVPTKPPTPSASGIQNIPINSLNSNQDLVLTTNSDFVIPSTSSISVRVQPYTDGTRSTIDTDKIKYKFTSNDSHGQICTTSTGCPAVAVACSYVNLSTAPTFTYCGSTPSSYNVIFKSVSGQSGFDTLTVSATDLTVGTIVFNPVVGQTRIWFYSSVFSVEYFATYGPPFATKCDTSGLGLPTNSSFIALPVIGTGPTCKTNTIVQLGNIGGSPILGDFFLSIPYLDDFAGSGASNYWNAGAGIPAFPGFISDGLACNLNPGLCPPSGSYNIFWSWQ
jgi:hypothetical protein